MLVSKIANKLCKFSEVAGEPTFLKQVEGYFNKAAKVAGIADDRIDFLRSPECSLKFNLSYVTGILQSYTRFWLDLNSSRISSSAQNTSSPNQRRNQICAKCRSPRS